MNPLKNQRRAVVFANGPVSDYASLSEQLVPSDVIICVDGGLRHIDALALTPAVVIGDMDSISAERLAELGGSVAKIQYPSEKDETDLELALQWAGDNAFDKVLLAGISGGRLDHTLANIHLMAAKPWPFDVCAWQPGQYSWLMTSAKQLALNNYRGCTLSLLAMSEMAQGISTTGVKYKLDDETLNFGSTRGVSNVIESEQASVYLTAGRMLVVVTYQEAGFP